MPVTTTQHIRKPLFVDAVRITGANFDDVATWCQGEIRQDEVRGKETGKKFIHVRVHNPKHARQTKAFVGDWILYTDRGYKIYTNRAFKESFDETGTGEMPEVYPYDEGDVTVLGPETFVARDGSVLSWKGVNYVPQSADRSVEAEIAAADEAEELEEARTAGMR